MTKSEEEQRSPTEDASTDTLSKVKSLFNLIMQSLEDSKTSEKQANENKELFNGVVNWCVENWLALVASIAEEKAVLDIVGELQKMRSLEGDAGDRKASLLPLHELLPHKGTNSISTLLIFKQGGCAMLPCSKIQFYSDRDGTRLVREVLAGNDMKADMGSMILNEGKVWVNFIAGTKQLLAQYEQEAIEAKLECAVF